MKVSVLASGSKGNCTYIETLNHKILIDLGMTTRYIEEKLVEIGINPQKIDMVFLTHNHTDHIKGLNVFVKKYNPIVYLTRELNGCLGLENKCFLEKNQTIDSLDIKTIKTSHDAEDSVGFVFEEENSSLVYITDTGYLNVKYKEILKNKNIYIIESNHDVEMLMNGPYRYDLKVRILGDRGHLSNKTTAEYLSDLVGDKTNKIILAHLSEENNTKELAYNEVTSLIKDIEVIIATQKERTDLFEV